MSNQTSKSIYKIEIALFIVLEIDSENNRFLFETILPISH